MEVKQPKAYEELISVIQKKGFIIDDISGSIDFLKQANYYRLSAYFLPFRQKDGTYRSDDSSSRGIDFSRIQRIYDFDSHIRSLLFQAIEQVEFYLRTTFSYYIAHKYGSLGYLNGEIFSERHNDERFKERLEQCIRENQRSLVVRHHLQKYDGNFPIWVIIEFFSMGMLSYCYGDLKSKDQKEIARESFSASSSCLVSWLRCLTDLRNRCAHYSRLYYWTFPAIPQTPKGSCFKLDRHLFSQIMMLKYIYPDKAVWNTRFVSGLHALVEEYQPDISMKHIGFPDDWEKLLRA